MSIRSGLITWFAALALATAACGSSSNSGGTGGSKGTGGGGGSATGGGGGTATGGSPGSGGAPAGGDAASTGGSDGGARDAAASDGPVGTDGSITPSGDGGASPMMSFFITSEKSMTGNLGGIAGADAKCARLAAAVGSTGKTWKAYLSTSTENARARIGNGPWYNVRGVMIAANLAQLHEEGGMKNGISLENGLTEKGEIVPGRDATKRPPGATANEHDIMTGSMMDGTVNGTNTCGDWTSAATTDKTWVGHFDRSGTQADPVVAASWNAAHIQPAGCADTGPGGGAGRIYCFAAN
jgi:hypothetical protein